MEVNDVRGGVKAGQRRHGAHRAVEVRVSPGVGGEGIAVGRVHRAVEDDGAVVESVDVRALAGAQAGVHAHGHGPVVNLAAVVVGGGVVIACAQRNDRRVAAIVGVKVDDGSGDVQEAELRHAPSAGGAHRAVEGRAAAGVRGEAVVVPHPEDAIVGIVGIHQAEERDRAVGGGRAADAALAGGQSHVAAGAAHHAEDHRAIVGLRAVVVVVAGGVDRSAVEIDLAVVVAVYGQGAQLGPGVRRAHRVIEESVAVGVGRQAPVIAGRGVHRGVEGDGAVAGVRIDAPLGGGQDHVVAQDHRADVGLRAVVGIIAGGVDRDGVQVDRAGGQRSAVDGGRQEAERGRAVHRVGAAHRGLERRVAVGLGGEAAVAVGRGIHRAVEGDGAVGGGRRRGRAAVAHGALAGGHRGVAAEDHLAVVSLAAEVGFRVAVAEGIVVGGRVDRVAVEIDAAVIAGDVQVAQLGLREARAHLAVEGRVAVGDGCQAPLHVGRGVHLAV